MLLYYSSTVNVLSLLFMCCYCTVSELFIALFVCCYYVVNNTLLVYITYYKYIHIYDVFCRWMKMAAVYSKHESPSVTMSYKRDVCAFSTWPPARAVQKESCVHQANYFSATADHGAPQHECFHCAFRG